MNNNKNNTSNTLNALDTIYRQAAIDAMMALQAEDDEAYGCHIPEGFDGERAKEALEVLPSAQPGRYKWNPIKDGLPDEEGVYFVTDDAGGMATVYLDVFSHYEDGSPYWLYSQNVTAWMHTPEPYKEDER